MSDLARQQAEFQRGILDGDKTVLAEILDSPREKRDVLFGVYRYAYGSRLVEAMRNDHELLHLYLGDEMFDEMGHAYVKALRNATMTTVQACGHFAEMEKPNEVAKLITDFVTSN